MATIDVGMGYGGRRSTNHELPLVPFIDFLLCLVAFLLVTAVWSQMARIEADANVPGSEPQSDSLARERELHVEVRGERQFRLVWREGSTVINAIDVERKPVGIGDQGDYRFPGLAERIAAEWISNGTHRAPTDPKLDRAVLHSDNTIPFAELVAVMDAVHSAKRTFTHASRTESASAFSLSFAFN